MSAAAELSVQTTPRSGFATTLQRATSLAGNLTENFAAPRGKLRGSSIWEVAFMRFENSYPAADRELRETEIRGMRFTLHVHSIIIS